MSTRNGTTVETLPPTVTSEALADFRSALAGEVLTAADAQYDEARQIWNGMIDKRPALIARCHGVADVIAAVNFAREHDLIIAVRGGGHNVAGTALCDGGIVIDLSQMNAVWVDPAARTVRAQGGAIWGDVDRETQVFGLATTGGNVAATGIAGLTLGGGYGHLRRKYGMTIDNLLSVDIVTAEGTVLRASEHKNADLFWALRGGGGNFGIVTSFEYRLYPVGPTVMLCAVMHPVENARDILRAWRDFMQSAPEEFSSLAIFWNIPVAEGFPPEVQGKPILLLAGVYCGEVEEGMRLVQPLRELETPLLDISGPTPWTAVQSAFDPLLPNGELRYWKSLFLNNLDDEVIDAFLNRAIHRPHPKSLVAIWHHGGAMSRVESEATAYGDRSAPYLLSIDTAWLEPTDNEDNIAWTRRLWQDMQRFSSGGIYLNFPGLLEEGEQLLRDTFGANYERLVAVKNRYDPNNVFRLNHNIKPTASSNVMP